MTICSPSFRLPPNFASLSYDRKDDVRSFRLYVGDILKEVCGVLGPGAVLPPLVYDLIAQVTIYFSYCLSLSFFLSLSPYWVIDLPFDDSYCNRWRHTPVETRGEKLR